VNEFPQVQDGDEITPEMDGYGMKCCDCHAVHRFKFRAIRVTKHMPDGTFAYEVLDPEEYRVELTATRPVEQPQWPKQKRKTGPGQPMCDGCPGYGTHPRCCVDPVTHQYKPASERVRRKWWHW
jgi:hypothetical protein